MNPILKRAQQVLASATMVTTVLGLAGFAALTPATALAVTPADYGLHEGDVIRATGDLDIYIVNDWGYKRLFVNPAIFNLYGHLGWSKVKAVSAATRDAFVTSGLFRNCETGDQKVYGLDVVSEDVANLRWVNTTGAQAVADDANFFKKVFCINSAESRLYGSGAAFTSVSQVPAYSRGATGTGTVGGSVSASLSSDNPAANTVIAGQGIADLAHFTFSGSGAVTSVTLSRIGVSSDTTLSNVYLYQGTKRLTDAATVSSGKISFNDANGLFTVNGSANISVRADIATGTSGQTVGAQLADYTVGGSKTASVLSGNLMSVAATPSDFGTLTMGATTTPALNAALDPQNDLAMWQNSVSVGNHDLSLRSVQFRVIGSIGTADIGNFRLYIDGIQVGSAVSQVDANKNMVFDLSATPFTLRTGTRVVKVVGDVVGGSAKDFYLSLRQKTDIYAVESQYSQPVLTSGTFPVDAGKQTVNSGSLTIIKATDSTSGDIVKDSSNVALARFQFKAYGESMKVESLRVKFTSSTAALEALRNASLYVDGVQVGSTQTLWENSVTSSNSAANVGYTTYNLGSSFVVVPGAPRVLEVRADIYDNAGTNNVTSGATIKVQLDTGSSNVQRLTKLDYVSYPASGTVDGNTLTVRTGSFSAAKYTGYANQSVVVPKSQFKIGHYALTAATSEDINVNTINVDMASVSANELSNMFLKVWNDAGTLVYSSTPKATVSGTASNSYSVNLTIPKTKTWQVEVFADLQSKLGTDTFNTNLDASGLTAASSTTATAAEATGQSITATTGSLNLANGSIGANRIINGPQTTTAYSFTLQPNYDDYTLDEATFKLSSTVASSQNAVGMLYLKDGGTIVGSSPITTTASSAFTLSGLSYPLAQLGGTKTLTVDVALNAVGVGANDTGGLVKVQLSHLKYHNSSGTNTTSVVDPATYTGNSFYVFKAYPSFAKVNLPSTVITAGEQALSKVLVTAVGGPVGLKKVIYSVTTGTATTRLTDSAFKLLEDGVDVTSLGAFATASCDFSAADCSAGAGKVSFTFTNERTISSSKTYQLMGTVTALAANDSVVTKIGTPSAAVTTDDATTVAATTASVVWSDQSSVSHSTTTDDWMNDYLLPGDAMNSSQTVSR